jgi:hypothetical protein
VTVNRRPFSSNKDHIGLAPYNAQLGDQICMLFGSQVPIVLQTTDTDADWLFVSEAYVNGTIDSEADDLMMDSEGDVNVRTFRII